MRILIVNTSEKTGGAAVAARRLMEALQKNGTEVTMMVGEKQTDSPSVVGVGTNWSRQWAFLWERWCIFWHLRFSRDHLFEVDMGAAGIDITKTRAFREADVIHLHWVQQSMLSLRGLRRIVESGKPVVWTMHDFWPCTAICHYPRDCREYERQCASCPYLPSTSSKLAARTWQRKQHIWSKSRMAFVTCSQWLGERARQSSLLNGLRVVSIPNTIDTGVYCPHDKQKARQQLGLPTEGRLLLFVSQRITDKRKGMDFFIEACHKLKADAKTATSVVVLGGHSEELEGKLSLPTIPLGYVSNEQTIVDVYCAVDAYVLPSLEDNLPNTIMEAMACGVPCVGFRTGGIPEMIDHKMNGYVADYRDSDDLAKGMQWVLAEADYDELSRQAVAKVRQCYSQQAVAKRYIEVYESVMDKK